MTNTPDTNEATTTNPTARRILVRHAFVMMDHDGRTLLGNVTDVRGDRLAVRHFNGEPWPVSPLAADVAEI